MTFLGLALVGLEGCHSAQPNPGAEEAIASSLGLTDAIVFRQQGGPIDEPFDSSDALTLSEALRRAMMTDPEIQAALARLRIAVADATQARLWPNPILNIAVRWPESGGTIIEASLAQDVISILAAPRRASAADNRLRQTAADALTVALDAAAELQERYVAVQAVDELLPVLESRRTLLNKLVEVAQARLEAGEGTREDVTILKAQQVELDVEIAQAQLSQRDERLRLARLVGEPSSAAIWKLDPWNPTPHLHAAESTCVDAALQHRPEIQSVHWKLAALGDDLALARWWSWEGASAGAQAERDGEWSVGPQISSPLPLFDMGQARSARASAEQIEARHELTLAKRVVVEEVRRAYESLDRTVANLRRVRDELIPLQERRRASAEATFRTERDIIRLILAEQDLRAAQAKAVDLERDATIALIRLHRAVGGGGIANLVAHASTANDVGSSASGPREVP